MYHLSPLTHWVWKMHICISKLNIIGSNDGLSPSRRQAIIWNNAGKLLTEPHGKKFSAILTKIYTFSFLKTCLKTLSQKWQPFSLGFNVLRMNNIYILNKIKSYVYFMWYAVQLQVHKQTTSPWWCDPVSYTYQHSTDTILLFILMFVTGNSNQEVLNIEADTFCRQHLQGYFLEWK